MAKHIQQDSSRNLMNAGLKIEFCHIPTGNMVEFKAFLTNYAEQYSSAWNSETTLGRMDPIETFKGTRRTISLGWAIPSFGVDEAKENQKKITQLIQMLYPTYTGRTKEGFGVMSAPPLLRLKFANLIQDPFGLVLGEYSEDEVTVDTSSWGEVCNRGLVGRVDGLQITPDSDAGYITVQTGPKDGPGAPQLYPKTVNITCTYYVIHTYPLGWDGKKFLNPGHPYGHDSGFGELAKSVPPEPSANAAVKDTVGKKGDEPAEQPVLDPCNATNVTCP